MHILAILDILGFENSCYYVILFTWTLLLYFFSNMAMLEMQKPIQMQIKMMQQKSHTCEEGGAQLQVSFWHLLMNLKNKYLLKKLLKWANKCQNNFNIYNAALF